MRSLSVGCLLVCLMCLSCRKPLPELKGIETEVWTADKNGCSGARANSIEALKEQKTALLGLSEMEIVQDEIAFVRRRDVRGSDDDGQKEREEDKMGAQSGLHAATISQLLREWRLCYRDSR